MSRGPDGDRGIILPRGLIILCCCWIAATWMLFFGLRPPVQAVSASYVESVMMMVTSTVMGIMIGWPLMRTTGRRFTAPFRQTILDMIVLACAAQVIIWPLRLVSTWSSAQAFLLTMELTALIIVVGALVNLGASATSPLIRTLVMTFAMIMVMSGLLLHEGDVASWWSPVDTARWMTSAPQGAPLEASLRTILLTGVSGLGLWLVSLGLVGLLGSSGTPDSKPVD